jgi:hypothetical protein
MYKVTILTLVISVLISFGASASEPKVNSMPSSRDMSGFHDTAKLSAKDAVSGLDVSIKNKKLDNYPMATIGEAIGNYQYFSKRDWKVTQLPYGKIYVDFTGMFKKGFFSFLTLGKGVSQRGLDVKFVIYSDGRFGVAMISRVEVTADGVTKTYPIEDTKAILDKIYGNKEIKFKL